MQLIVWALVACQCRDTTPTNTNPPPTTTTPEDACAEHPGESICVGDAAVVCDDVGAVQSTSACGDDQVCADGSCVPCGQGVVDVPYADQDRAFADGVRLQVDPAGPSADRGPFLRPVDVLEDGTLHVSGPVQVFGPGGSPLTDGASVASGDRLLLAGTGPGTGSVAVDAASCSAVLPFTAGPPSELAGRSMTGFPFFETPDVFSFEDDDVSVLVDPGTWPERVGQPFDAYVVPYRDPSAWAADPSLAGASPVAGPVAGEVGDDSVTDALAVWDPTRPDELTVPYSLVLDFGQDGQVDPGDLVDGWDAPGLWIAGDHAADGPYTPQSLDVELSYWHSFMVYWPQELDSLDPMPVVVLSHGNGHDYHWYDYLGNHFASHGYVMISHRNDTADASIVPAATTTWENTEAFLTSLDSIAGGALAGHVDPHRIAWIGHSRGGEGVVMAYHWLESGQISPSSYSTSDIQLVASIAPTTFNPVTIINPGDLPVYSLLAGSADGDVTGGVDSYVVEYFRIFQNSTGLQTVTYVHGATHNDFNCCGFADGAGIGPGPLIGRNAAQVIAKSYFLAELHAVFDGHDEEWEWFSRVPENFLPPGVESPVATVFRRAQGDRMFVLEDYQTEPDDAVSSSGGAVTWTAANYVDGSLNDADTNLTWSDSEPMNGFTWSESGDANPSGGAVLDWDAGTSSDLTFDVVAEASDWTAYRWLSFKACQGTRHPYTTALGDMLSFTVEVEDADGNTSDVDFRVHGGVPPPFRRDGSGTGVGWVNEFQTVRLPISDFVARGTPLDLSRVAKVRFRFGQDWGSAEGRVGLDDLMLLQEVVP